MKEKNYVYNEIKNKLFIIKNQLKLIIYYYPGIIFIFLIVLIFSFLYLYKTIYLPIATYDISIYILNNKSIFNIIFPKLYNILLILNSICAFYIIKLASSDYQKKFNFPIQFYSLILSNFLIVYSIFIIIIFLISSVLGIALNLNIIHFIIFFIFSVIISFLNILLIICLEFLIASKIEIERKHINLQIIVNITFITLSMHFLINYLNRYLPYFYLIILLISPLIIEKLVQIIYYLSPPKQIIGTLSSEKNKYFLHLNELIPRINIYLWYEFIAFFRNIRHYFALVFGLIICMVLLTVFFPYHYYEIINSQLLNATIPSLTAITIGIDYEYKHLLVNLPLSLIKRNSIKYLFNLFMIVIILFVTATVFKIPINLNDMIILLININIIYILTIFLKHSIISEGKNEVLLYTFYMFINFLSSFIFYELIIDGMLLNRIFLIISTLIIYLIIFKRSL